MSKTMTSTIFALGLCATLVLGTGAVMAQGTSYDIRSGEVLSVSGNSLVVRGPNGVREYVVSDDFRFDMDGKPLSVHELKPGMKLTAMITTTETPVEMTSTEVKNAEVIHTIGTALIVRNTDDGKIRKFTADQIREAGLIIYKDGKAIDPTSLRTGDRFSATIVTKLPPTFVTEQEIAVLAQNAPPPPPKPRPAPAPVAAPAAAPAPAPAPAPARQLPKTGSPLPLIGLLGALALAGGMALTLRRRLLRTETVR